MHFLKTQSASKSMEQVKSIYNVDIKENFIKSLDNALLAILLKDKSSGRNLIWATDTYISYGAGFGAQDYITEDKITGKRGFVIKPRTEKSQREQQQRIKDKAEVFTPSWVCNKMNNFIDNAWFGQENVFNFETEKGWTVNSQNVVFPEGKTWQDYVSLTCFEITCGEAPYITSRYDTVTGEFIEVENRIGVLDRKLRAISENTVSEEDWYKWAQVAFKSVYGFDFQGDNVLIARENLLFTFIEAYEYKFNVPPIKAYLLEIAKILAWNIWQMDGLKYVIPYSCKQYQVTQITLEDLCNENAYMCEGCLKNNNAKHTGIYSKIMNWQTKRTNKFFNVKGENKMKFDFVIGNPPYQQETESDSTRMPPIYDNFMDSAYKISDRVELITPARFLFDAGYTPKAWNRKMLNDEHFKVLFYESKSAAVFPTTDIKGGIAITYRDCNKNFGAIGTFTTFAELNSILHKVLLKAENFLDSICYPALSYNLTPLVMQDFPQCVGRLRTSAFTKLSEIFFEEKPNDGHEYIEMIGLLNAKRTKRYVRRDYIKTPDNFEFYKIILPASNGSGAIGEVLSTPLIGSPLIGSPLIGSTQTFISIGRFETKSEGEACFKYIKSKFARTMLGILKITQHNPPEKWKYVPLQDFTANSDIDWSQSVADIDVQLYKKYGLSEEEIKFIETHVKEMV